MVSNFFWSKLLYKKQKPTHIGIQPIRGGSIPALWLVLPIIIGLVIYIHFPVHFYTPYYILIPFVMFGITLIKWGNAFIITLVIVCWGYGLGMVNNPHHQIPIGSMLDNRVKGKFYLQYSHRHHNYHVYKIFIYHHGSWKGIGYGKSYQTSHKDSRIWKGAIYKSLTIPIFQNIFQRARNFNSKVIWVVPLKKDISSSEEILADDMENEARQLFKKRVYEICENRDAAAFLVALLSGDTKDLQMDTKLIFEKTGTLHILAVSGLHIGLMFIMAGFVLTILFRRFEFKSKEIWLAIVQVALVWGYGVFTGLPPSVMRACLMTSVFGVGKALGLTAHPLNLLFFSGLIQIHINPWDIFSLGFQYSYTAVLSIVLVQPILKRYVNHFQPWVKVPLELIIITVVAQLGTSMISLYHFHTFPLSFLPANMLAIPITTGMTYVGFAMLFPLGLDTFFGYLQLFLYTILKRWLQFWAEIDWAWLTNIGFGPEHVVLYVFILYSIYHCLFTFHRYFKWLWIIPFIIFLSIDSGHRIECYSGIWKKEGVHIQIHHDSTIIYYFGYDSNFIMRTQQWSLSQGVKFFHWDSTKNIQTNVYKGCGHHIVNQIKNKFYDSQHSWYRCKRTVQCMPHNI